MRASCNLHILQSGQVQRQGEHYDNEDDALMIMLIIMMMIMIMTLIIANLHFTKLSNAGRVILIIHDPKYNTKTIFSSVSDRGPLASSLLGAVLLCENLAGKQRFALRGRIAVALGGQG